MSYPKEGDPGLTEVARNPSLVRILMVRDYERNGGLVLPPRDGARQIAEQHAAYVRYARSQGLQEHDIQIVEFPRW